MENRKFVSLNLPYFSLNEYFKSKYHFRVQKITVSLPFTCPNRDGKTAKGGCIFCYNGSMPSSNSTEIKLEKQIKEGISKGRQKYGKDTMFIVYFQTYSNTYASVDELKKIYDVALKYPEVMGIDIGTRPDCVSDEILELIKSYMAKLPEVWLELGLQSANEETLIKINRGHTVQDFVGAVKKTKEKGIKITAHMIAGLPWENSFDFMKTAGLIASLGIEAIKIHPLYVMEDTELGRQYKKEEFKLLSLDMYINTLADIVETLPEGIILARFTAEGEEKGLLAPEYCRTQHKSKIKELLIKELKKRGTKQGAKFTNQ